MTAPNQPRVFVSEQDDEPDTATYVRVPASDLEDCDQVDSRTIVDEGAPA